MCVGPAIGTAEQRPEEFADLPSLAACSQSWPELSPYSQGWNLKSIQILPAQVANPPALSIPRLPPMMRLTMREMTGVKTGVTSDTATGETAVVPALQPELVIKAAPKKPRSPLFPNWIVRTVVASVILLAVASSVHRFVASPSAEVSANTARRPNPRRAAAASSLVTPVATPAPKIALEADNETEYPFARFVEVSGLKVVDLINDHSQVQYIVINHSSTQLTDIGLRIAVRSSATSGGSAPLFTLAARVPTLGPNESKEMRIDLDSKLRTTQIPGWPNLRTDVRVVIP